MKRNASTLVAGLLLFLSSFAMAASSAENSNATEKARASFHHAVQLYNEGSFEAALAEFRKAYDLTPNYRLLYNIAQTYFDLHDYVSSSKNLKQYMQEGGGEISAARRAEVNDLAQKLEDRIAYVEVVCNVEGADIRVDDMSVGMSPLPAAIPVNAGPRRVSAVKAGYAVATRMITVVGKEKSTVSIDIAESAPTQTDLLSDGVTQRELAKPKRIALATSALVAGGCAVAAGVFGVLAWQAKGDFDSELDKFPNNKSNVDNARSKMKTYAYLTDALGAATLVSGGVALYLLITESGSKKAPSKDANIALIPTLGGMSLNGRW
jgi:tetratricopeptide (TPR) repeat protein